MNNLRIRIVFSVFLPIISLTLIITTIFIASGREQQFREIETTLEIIAKANLDELMLPPNSDYDEAVFQAENSLLLAKDRIESYLVRNQLKDEIAFQFLHETIKGEESPGFQRFSEGDSNFIVYTVPFSMNDTKMYLRLITNTSEELERYFTQVHIYMTAIVIIILLLLTIVSFWLANFISRPLVKMVGFAKRISEGDFKIRVAGKHYGEAQVLASALNQMAEQIERLDQLKDVFLASISHELKTPLTSIRGWSATLNYSKHLDTERLKVGLRIIETESDRLSRLVEQLLDFSSYVSGNRLYMPSTVAICSFVKEVVEQFQLRAEQQLIELRFFACEVEQMTELDQDKMKQVLINLIDNALKFTTAGGEVTIRVEANSKLIVCHVEDTGCGIKPEDVDQVMKQFYKADPKSSGSGLGLTICKRIIELHDGELCLFSEVGVGTRVQITIPCRHPGGEIG